MTIFYKGQDVAPGLKDAVNHVIRAQLTDPGAGFLPQLLDGSAKMLVIEYNGDMEKPYNDQLRLDRGDGRLHLLRPQQPGYRLPGVFSNWETWNIRAAVPLLLVGPWNGSHRPVLGIGGFHPRWSSATIYLYCPQTQRQLCRMYFGDPRSSLDDPAPGHAPKQEQWEWLKEAGGWVPPAPARARRYYSALSIY